jgi:hypothetical protein
MTLDEIRNSTKEVLTPADIADVLNADPQDIRVQARTAPEKLGFPVIIIKSRTKIPRVPFLRFMGEK